MNPTSGPRKALIHAPHGYPGHSCRASFTAAPHFVRHMRRLVRACLDLWCMSGLSGDAELCVTELVTNVMRHVPDRRCTVRVFREDGGVLVEVRDSSPVLPTLRRAELLEESGRGIATVDLLAHEWGAEPAEGGGKVVWFRMRVRPPVG